MITELIYCASNEVQYDEKISNQLSKRLAGPFSYMDPTLIFVHSKRLGSRGVPSEFELRLFDSNGIVLFTPDLEH